MIIDLHCHTSPRSMCSSLQPADLVRQAKSLGLDGVCLTEHDELWPKELVERLSEEHGFMVLRGMEVSTDAGHVLVFGLERYVWGLWDVRRLRDAVDDVNGIMIRPHPLRDSSRRVQDAEIPLLFDALEVLNGSESGQSNSCALALSQQLGLKGVGGSDAHSVHEVGTCVTEFDGEIRNERDLVEALRANGYKARRLK